MPIFMDRHYIEGATHHAMKNAHEKDLYIEDRYHIKGTSNNRFRRRTGPAGASPGASWRRRARRVGRGDWAWKDFGKAPAPFGGRPEVPAALRPQPASNLYRLT
jgi:hypothetical protein